MLQAKFKDFMVWLAEIKEEMDLGELPEDDTAETLNFDD